MEDIEYFHLSADRDRYFLDHVGVGLGFGLHGNDRLGTGGDAEGHAADHPVAGWQIAHVQLRALVGPAAPAVAGHFVGQRAIGHFGQIQVDDLAHSFFGNHGWLGLDNLRLVGGPLAVGRLDFDVSKARLALAGKDTQRTAIRTADSGR